MAKEVIEDKEAFFTWLAQQPLIKAAQQKIDTGIPLVHPPSPVHAGFTKAEMSDEDRAFAEAMKGMA